MTKAPETTTARADLDAALSSLAPLAPGNASLAAALLGRGMEPGNIVATILEGRMRVAMPAGAARDRTAEAQGCQPGAASGRDRQARLR